MFDGLGKGSRTLDRGREAQWLLKGWLIEINANWPSNHRGQPNHNPIKILRIKIIIKSEKMCANKEK